MRPSILLLHVANIVLPGLTLVALEHTLVRLTMAVLLFFGLFTLMHDAMHGALGLPRRINEWVITLSGILVGVSGHTTRWFHLRHHAHPLEADDVEGRGAVLPLHQAILEAPGAWLALPFIGWRRAPARISGIAVAEWLGVVAFGGMTLAVPDLRIYLGVVLAAQLTIPLWAARVPHRPPLLLLAMARRLAWTRSPLVVGPAFHQAHHERPRVPAYGWPADVTERNRGSARSGSFGTGRSVRFRRSP